MTFTFETTILGGLPVTVEASMQPAEPDVGIMGAYVDEWCIVEVNGRECSKHPAWIAKRMTNKDDELLEEECAEAYADC